MVVLSASICSGQGKALVSRQFVEMTRMRVEGLFAAFPKLVGHAKQHTFVETDTVRYVYQPLENNLYLLLITTKTSNIVEDLGTLRLLAKVVPDVAGSVAEVAINDHSFELIFAFDEVLTAGGYKEEATLSSIRTNLLMDSHEEKMHVMLMESKKAEAAEQMKKRQKDIRERQMQQMKQNFMNNGPGGAGMPSGGMEGFGGGGGAPSAYGGFGSDSAPPPGAFDYNKPAEPEPVDEGPKVIAKGMTLGGIGKKKDNMMAAMAAEDNLGSLLGGGAKGGASDLFGLGTATASPAAAPTTPLTLALEEKLTVTMNREGAIGSAEVKGNLTLTANTDVGAAAIVAVNRPEIAAKCTTDWSFATHPKVDKRAYEKTGKVSLKGGKAFPVGRPVGVLKWSYSAEDAAPITINCWPEDDGSGGVVNVNIEFELNQDRPDMVLRDVNIVLPLGTTDPPAIEAIDGQYKHDPARGMLCWHHDVVDSSNSTGSLEFTVPGSDVDAFFPVQVMFTSETLYCPIEILSVTSSSDGANIPNAMSKALVPETYQCV
eukprot:CAMPEP_0197438406 /NCGR_PEP_ID=MMETSP1175-20131217/5417_1 /TAXON_ID=1003142 /ORGANISM="Triceratium dubium, Strain CCMP147" /LENGTH=542 /DNA_ID=CAMNT_0042968131 /DNA_START=130 /DNA_END=1758 /DNA_ORIENTATION=-